MQRMQRHEEAIIDRIVDACLAAARDDGVECVLLGCTCMAPVGPIVQKRVPFPVIECSRVGFDVAMAGARSGARHEVVVPERRRLLVPRIVDAYASGGASPAPLPELASDDECPVCVFTPRDAR